ncbi:MAG: metallophosphoesterase [Hyphomicrobiaceae bacterium]
MIFTLAHLSDPHLPPLPLPALAEWNIKRLLGVLNWHHRRKRQHRADILARLLADLHQQAPDHIAVTGDLANLGLPVEHVSGLQWLETVGTPEDVTVIPGNHDIYTDIGHDPGVERWHAYMAPLPPGANALIRPTHFPFVRRIGALALIGLNSAVPTPPLYASGRLGPDQRTDLARQLQDARKAGLVRVVLIHHPPIPGLREARCALEDAADLAEVLRQHGAELVLHGHNHRAMMNFVESPDGPVPIVGVPSASMAEAHGRQNLARYNLYRITDVAGSPAAIEMIERGITTPDGPVQELSRKSLAPKHGVGVLR